MPRRLASARPSTGLTRRFGLVVEGSRVLALVAAHDAPAA
jgi:hypothetical protein